MYVIVSEWDHNNAAIYSTQYNDKPKPGTALLTILWRLTAFIFNKTKTFQPNSFIFFSKR